MPCKHSPCGVEVPTPAHVLIGRQNACYLWRLACLPNLGRPESLLRMAAGYSRPKAAVRHRRRWPQSYRLQHKRARLRAEGVHCLVRPTCSHAARAGPTSDLPFEESMIRWTSEAGYGAWCTRVYRKHFSRQGRPSEILGVQAAKQCAIRARYVRA